MKFKKYYLIVSNSKRRTFNSEFEAKKAVQPDEQILEVVEVSFSLGFTTIDLRVSTLWW